MKYRCIAAPNERHCYETTSDHLVVGKVYTSEHSVVEDYCSIGAGCSEGACDVCIRPISTIILHVKGCRYQFPLKFFMPHNSLKALLLEMKS